MDGFELFGVVKETGIDDEGLAEFSKKYFGGFPLYCDKSYCFYQALGDRKTVQLPSLWTVFTSFLSAWTRIGSKNIEWNSKGEGVVQGGIMIFDAKGKLKFAYKEETGVDVPVKDIAIALEAARREFPSSTGSSTPPGLYNEEMIPL